MVDTRKMPTLALQRMPTEIDGFYEIAGGQLPHNRTSIITGDGGSGETVFALQTLVNGAQCWNVLGIFVTFEKHSRDILANAASVDWDLEYLSMTRNCSFLVRIYCPESFVPESMN